MTARTAGVTTRYARWKNLIGADRFRVVVVHHTDAGDHVEQLALGLRSLDAAKREAATFAPPSIAAVDGCRVQSIQCRAGYLKAEQTAGGLTDAVWVDHGPVAVGVPDGAGGLAFTDDIADLSFRVQPSPVATVRSERTGAPVEPSRFVPLAAGDKAVAEQLLEAEPAPMFDPGPGQSATAGTGRDLEQQEAPTVDAGEPLTLFGEAS